MKHFLSFFFFFGVLVFPFNTGNAQVFPDIPKNSQYYNAVEFFSQKGVITGYDDGYFRSNAFINRAEFTKIILISKYLEEEIHNKKIEKISFSDISSSDWFYEYIVFAYKNNVIEGYSNETFFLPYRPITKAEASKMVVKNFLSFVTIGGDDDCSNILIQDILNKNISKTCSSERFNGDNWWTMYTNILQLLATSSENSSLKILAQNLDINGSNYITRGEMVQLLYEIQEY